jgi:hypothetical protein
LLVGTPRSGGFDLAEVRNGGLRPAELKAAAGRVEELLPEFLRNENNHASVVCFTINACWNF